MSLSEALFEHPVVEFLLPPGPERVLVPYPGAAQGHVAQAAG